MKKLNLFFIIFISVFIIDQIVKYGFAHFDWNVAGPVMSLQLAYNKGVAFSMFSFLDEYLKYIQLGIVIAVLIYLFKNRQIFYEYYLATAVILAGGLSNILDRFTYGAVVDYFYWHYLFDFAIFNIADVMIDLGVVLIIYKQIKNSRKEKLKTEVKI